MTIYDGRAGPCVAVQVVRGEQQPAGLERRSDADTQQPAWYSGCSYLAAAVVSCISPIADLRAMRCTRAISPPRTTQRRFGGGR